jgi:hypothetical protein
MITDEQARVLFLSMPVVEEKSRYGRPDFRVKQKAFATIFPGRGRVDLRVGEEEQVMLSTQKLIYSIPEEGREMVSVKLAAIGEEEFREVVWKAWRYTARPQLSNQY